MYGIEAASKSPTSVNLIRQNSDPDASRYEYKVVQESGNRWLSYVASESSINITNLSPATSYIFSIIPEINGTRENATVVMVTTGKLTSSQGVLNLPFLLHSLEPCPFKLPVEKREAFINCGRGEKVLYCFRPRSSGGLIFQH